MTGNVRECPPKTFDSTGASNGRYKSPSTPKLGTEFTVATMNPTEQSESLHERSTPGYSGRSLLPRLIRLRDAPYFFGMDKNRFNREVRPFLTEIQIGHPGPSLRPP